jgi:hypothetical protein
MGSWSSSVSIVSDYRLDDRAAGVRFPTEAMDFPSSRCVQTGSVAHTTSYPVGTGGSFPRIKSSRGVKLTIPPHIAAANHE